MQLVRCETRHAKKVVEVVEERSNMPGKVVRTNPDLWEICKTEAVESMGKFSARAMQRAVVLYKKRGGGYEGKKTTTNALVAWNKKQPKPTKVLE